MSGFHAPRRSRPALRSNAGAFTPQSPGAGLHRLPGLALTPWGVAGQSAAVARQAASPTTSALQSPQASRIASA